MQSTVAPKASERASLEALQKALHQVTEHYRMAGTWNAETEALLADSTDLLCDVRLRLLVLHERMLSRAA